MTWWRSKNIDQTDAAAALSDSDRIIVAQGGSPIAKRALISALGTYVRTFLGTMASQASNNVSITGGTITGARVTGLSAPTVSSDAVTKAYADALALNVGSRGAVRVASTANVAVATGLAAGQTVDGKTIATGDLILLKNQTTTSENGVYVAPASGAASRSSQFSVWSEFPGSLVAVEEGTANAETLWICTSDQGGTLGTTAVAFVRIRIDIAIPVTAAQGGTGQDTSALSGIAKLAAGVWSFVTAPTGAIVGTSDTQTLTNKTMSQPAGTSSAPSINFGGSTITGIYSPAAGYVWSAYNGVSVAGMSGGVLFGIFNSCPLMFDSATGNGDVGLLRGAPGVLNIASGVLGVTGGTFASKANTPATLASGTTNNYSLAALPSYFQRITANAANSVLTGLTLTTAQVDGQEHFLVNTGSGTLTLNHQDAGSTAANRFLCSTGAALVLSANQGADLIYDGTAARWLAFKRN